MDYQGDSVRRIFLVETLTTIGKIFEREGLWRAGLDGPAMGDYGGNWRYGAATDGRRAGSTPTKRSRRDYGQLFLVTVSSLS